MKASAIVLVTWIFVSLFSLSVAACSTNQPPVIDGLKVENSQVRVSGSSEIFCSAADPEGGELTYEWSASGGTIEAFSPRAVWKAPDQPGNYSVSVTVQDERGNQATSQVCLSVLRNAAPVIESLIVEPSAVKEGQKGLITCRASDPEGGKLRYRWEAEKGELIEEGPQAVWLAPAGAGPCTLKVKVTDEDGNSALMSINVDVLPNHPPEIRSLTASPQSVAANKTSEIVCEAVDADGDDLQYQWEATAGTIAGDGEKIIWLAPENCQGVTVTARVSDGNGGMAVKTVKISVAKTGG